MQKHSCKNTHAKTLMQKHSCKNTHAKTTDAYTDAEHSSNANTHSILVHNRAENWWHISTQKPPNVGSSSAISEPIIAGLVSARGLPKPMKLGNQLHRPTQTG